MRVLILSCNTGQGHNSAAEAVRETFENRGHSCTVKNTLLFLSKIHDIIISDGHVFIYKHLPKLFGMGYRYEENHEPKFIQSQLRLGVQKFGKFLKGNRFDIIVCTHVFSSILVNEYKKKNPNFKCPCALISTDYTCYPGAFECNADLYFTAHPDLTEEFIEAGIDENKIISTGIPISGSFLEITEKEKAREILSLPQDKKIVLVGGGSMGCGPIVKLAELLSKELSDDGIVIVACGSNTTLLEKISKLEAPNVYPLPYTKQMSLYLDAADLYLSKAGGLSTTEAIYKGAALLYIAAVPGCESRNIDFMLKHGYAEAADTPESATIKALNILADNTESKENILKCRASLPSSSSDEICIQAENFIMSKQNISI